MYPVSELSDEVEESNLSFTMLLNGLNTFRSS